MKISFLRLVLSTITLLIGFHCFAQNDTLRNAQHGQVKLLGNTGELKYKTPWNFSNHKDNHRSGKSCFTNATHTIQAYQPLLKQVPAITDSIKNPVHQVSSVFSVEIPIVPILNFEGIDVTEAAGFPFPDPNGDVSPYHYIQMTNSVGGSIFKIFSKDGSLQYGPASLNTLWDSFGIIGRGNPIVLWDQGAGRWLFSELGELGSNAMLVAISLTSDPLGEWNAYEFQVPELPDHPKYGIWLDAYYVTTEEAGDTNIPVYALDRAAMLNGEPIVDLQRLGIPKFETTNTVGFQTATPVDWDGAASPPPGESPHYLLRMYDDAWDGGQDKLELWEVSIDWEDANNTTVTGPIDLITAPFDADVCNGSVFNCLAQSDQTTISASMQQLMHRAHYRNFGNYESIVVNHVVDVNGNNLAGIRWYELRKLSGGQWEIYQQGTLATDDNHRFMGSIALDAAGNIGLAYSTMGPNKNLSLAFTGRRLGDPSGEMTIDEFEFANGLSLHSGFRWGEYSMMAVDEEDGLTFWFTGEYMKADAKWGTRIMTFQLKEDSIDIGPTSIVAPQNSAYLTGAEQVQVSIKNFGLLPQSGFKAGLIVDGNFITEEIVLDTLYPDSIAIIVFNAPVDMSLIKGYNFKIYTQQDDDGNALNDTLRTIITKLPRFDAAITDFVDIAAPVCDSTHFVGITLTNKGAETLDSVLIYWSFNGGPQSVYNWTGNLEKDFSDTVYVLLDPLNNGINNITASTVDPNGVEDEDMDNDALERIFQVTLGGEPIFFNLFTDIHPAETSWTLSNGSGSAIYQGNQYPGLNTSYDEQWCLLEGCYTFTIYDSYGDGMSSGTPGSYTITDGDGHLLAAISNASFGDEETKTFCVPFVCSLAGESTTIKETYPNAFDGVISLMAMNGFPPFQYSIDGGNTFQESPVFTGLEGNTYPVVIMDINGCTVEMDVVLLTCTLQFTIIATNETTGQMDGSILINTENGAPPFLYSIDNGMSFQGANFFPGLSEGNYNILVQDSIGCTATFEITINAMGEVGVHEIPEGETIEILPNPTDDIFKIKVIGLRDVTHLSIELLDVTGRLLQRSRLMKNKETLIGQMSLQSFPKGVYFLRFGHPDIHRLAKVVRW